MRPLLTAAIWTVALGCLLVAGGLATLLVLMPVSLDPGEMITAGVEPWRDAGLAAAAFGGVALSSAACLWLWHRRRPPVTATLAWAIALGELALVAWASTSVIHEYF